MEAAAAGLALPGVRPFCSGDDFRQWVKGVERYLTAMDIRTAERRCAVLLHLLGPDIADTFETLPEPEPVPEGTGARDAFEVCKLKLEAYLAPTRNVIAERVAFHQMQMADTEDFEYFLGRLRVQLRRCGYSTQEMERELRDQSVTGCSRTLRERLLQKAAARGDELTLADVRSIALRIRTPGSWQRSWQAAPWGRRLATSRNRRWCRRCASHSSRCPAGHRRVRVSAAVSAGTGGGTAPRPEPCHAGMARVRATRQIIAGGMTEMACLPAETEAGAIGRPVVRPVVAVGRPVGTQEEAV